MAAKESPVKELQFIERVLREMSPYAIERYRDRATVGVTSKSDPNDLLTEVDVAVQNRTGALLRDAFPDDLFVGEEEGLAREPDDLNRRCWVMDPIDGTQNFVRGMFPAFAIALAFVEGNVVRAGGVAVPGLGDVYLAERGGGATRNGLPLRVSGVKELGLARVEIDFGGGSERRPTLDAAATIIERAGAVRCLCSAIIGLCEVATGDADAYLHVTLHPWDFAAAQVIVDEAGGRTTTLDGKPLHPFGPRVGVLASNGAIHEELLSAVRLPG
jgi:myo-inositol-1(or 4)-monophosphatase